MSLSSLINRNSMSDAPEFQEFQWEPEKELMRAMVIRSLLDLDSPDFQVSRQARYWLLADGTEEPWSCGWVLCRLGIECHQQRIQQDVLKFLHGKVTILKDGNRKGLRVGGINSSSNMPGLLQCVSE